ATPPRPKVPAPVRGVGGRPRAPHPRLVAPGARPRREQQHDLAWRGDTAADELPDAPRDRAGLAAPPAPARVLVAPLVRDLKLDRMAEDGVGELARGRERLVLAAELVAEELVDRREHFGAGPGVLRQRATAVGPLP